MKTKNMHQRRYIRSKQNMPAKTTNRENGRKYGKKQEHRRRHTVWGDIGLMEYNPQTNKWECRYEDCKEEKDKELLMHNHRNKKHPDHNLGRNRQNAICPYCNKTYAATDKIPMRLDLLLPQYGTYDAERCPELQNDDSPKERWIKNTTQNERKHAGTPSSKQEIPLPLPTNYKTEPQRPTPAAKPRAERKNSNASKTRSRTENLTKRKKADRSREDATNHATTGTAKEKKMKASQNMEKYGNDTHKKWERE